MSNQNLVNLTIDGESVAVPQGTTMKQKLSAIFTTVFWQGLVLYKLQRN